MGGAAPAGPPLSGRDRGRPRRRDRARDRRRAGRISAGRGSGSTPGGPSRPLLQGHGLPPLPPYIRRYRKPGGEDWTRYQTVYAARPGAVAAPTAGLHLTAELLAGLEARGVELHRVTLHVGPGTFRPVRARRLADHRMEAERFEVTEATAAALTRARREGRRVVAVGTTTVRTLEAVACPDGSVAPGSGWTDLTILPGHAFRVVDALLTNFHLPRSSLLLLVSAFAGRERILRAYAHAIAAGYRFYSYGDAMLTPRGQAFRLLNNFRSRQKCLEVKV